MATLQRIRNHSVALLVIVGLAMAAFIIGDLLSSSGAIMQHSRDKVVTINGTKVTYQEFETARSRMDELQKTLMGVDNTSSETAQRINQDVYNSFVNHMLLAAEGEKTGLTVSKGEFNELVHGANVSPILRQLFTNPNTGEYMSYIVEAWTGWIVDNAYDNPEMSAQIPEWASKSNWLVIEEQIKLDRLRGKFNALINAAIAPNSLEAENHFAGTKTECTFAYVRKPAYSVKDSLVKVSSEAVQKYYDASKYNYKTDESRSVEYIAVALTPSQADYAAAQKELEAVKEEFATTTEVADMVNSNSNVPYMDAYVAVSSLQEDIKHFVENNAEGAVMDPTQIETEYVMARIMGKTTAPDSLNVSLIFASNKAKADSIMRVVRPNNFAEVAKTASEDPQTAEKGGELGWMTDAALLANFGSEVRDAVVGAQLNRVVCTEVTTQGNTFYFITKVTDKTTAVAKAKVAIYANTVTPSSATRRAEYGKLNNFLLSNRKTATEAMKDSARAAGFNMIPTTLYTTNYRVGGVSDARQAVRFAFQSKVGEVSEIFECGDHLLALMVTGKTAAGYNSPKNASVKMNIERTLLSKVKAEKLVSDLANVSDKTLAGYAAAMEASVDTAQFVNFGLTYISGLGNEPKVIAAAHTAEVGQVVGPIAGNSNAVVLSLIEKKENAKEYNKEESLAQVAAQTMYAAAKSPMSYLVKYADIEDNRISFY